VGSAINNRSWKCVSLVPPEIDFRGVWFYTCHSSLTGMQDRQPGRCERWRMRWRKMVQRACSSVSPAMWVAWHSCCFAEHI
jgi:hypothetical protein